MTASPSLISQLKAIINEDSVFADYPLAKLTTFKCQGTAHALVKAQSASELAALIRYRLETGIPLLVLGKGSNTIFADDCFQGIIVQLAGEFKEISLVGQTGIKAGAALSTEKFSAFARQNGLGGAEFTATIPGTIGGAVFMNAGAHGAEIKDILTSAEFITSDGQIHSAAGNALSFGYRRSRFQQEQSIITSACFNLPPNSPEEVREKELELKKIRRDRQPIDKPTWGSVFMNPSEGESAGKLIEKCGLKGKGHGGARISPKHANFIENFEGRASYSDALATLRMARDAVHSQFGVSLQVEVRVFDGKGNLIEI